MFEPLSHDELTTTSAVESAKPTKVPIIPVPDDAPPMQFRHPEHGEPTKAWPYHDADGRNVGYVCRWEFENADGEQDKDFLPVTYCELGHGKRDWRSKGMPTSPASSAARIGPWCT